MADLIKIEMPPRERWGEVVPDSGTSCNNCAYLRDRENLLCGNPNFIAWDGPNKPANSARIPAASPNEYCSIWWKNADKEYKKQSEESDGSPKLVALFVRHGQTEANKERRFRGKLNIPLDDKGRQQALDVRRFLAGYLGSQPLGSVYNSGKDRALETANLVMGRGRSKTVKNFDPLNVGIFSGQPKNAENMKAIKYYQEHPEEKIPGGERLDDFRSRVNPEIAKVVEEGDKSGYPTISFVHSSTIHQVGYYLHNDHNAVKVAPGGVVGVFKRPNGGGYYAVALLHESNQDKSIMS